VVRDNGRGNAAKDTKPTGRVVWRRTRPVGDTGPVTSAADLPSRLIGLEQRIPTSLADLHGPSGGVVVLPLRLAWSSPTDYDVSDPGQRLTLYRMLLDCGQREDIIRYVNPELLRREWSRIRRLTSRAVIEVWESLLPDLAVSG
jgi:hypothetical protein